MSGRAEAPAGGADRAPLSAAELADIEDLAHDLGKYIRFDARWEAPDAPLEARWLARRRDLYETKKGQNTVDDAFSIGERARPSLGGGLGAAPSAARVAEAMDALAQAAPALLGPPPAEAEALLAAIDAGTTAVQEGLRAWRGWARAQRGGEHGEAARN